MIHDIEVKPCSLTDIPQVQDVYTFARDYQRLKAAVVWPEFNNELLMADIYEQRLFKIELNGRFAATFCITYRDKLIWGERDQQPAIYIHRIATHPESRGNDLVQHIVKWTTLQAKALNKKYVRLDTVGHNTGLIKYYQSCGFTFLGLFTLADTSGLPAHYAQGGCCLFQLTV